MSLVDLNVSKASVVPLGDNHATAVGSIMWSGAGILSVISLLFLMPVQALEVMMLNAACFASV